MQKNLQALSVVVLIFVLGASAEKASACQIEVIIGGNRYVMRDPEKRGGGGLAGPPATRGVGLDFAFGNGTGVNMDWLIASHEFPVGPPENFNVNFTDLEGLRLTLSSGVTVDMTTLSGGYLMNIEHAGPVETFTTGLLTLTGNGLGSDGHLYDYAFAAQSTNGVFGAPAFENGTQPGDPELDIVHPNMTNFVDVSVMLSNDGGMSTQENFSMLSSACYIDCHLTLVPEPDTVFLCLLGIPLFAGVRYGRNRKLG